MAEAIRMPAVEGTQGTLAGTLRMTRARGQTEVLEMSVI